MVVERVAVDGQAGTLGGAFGQLELHWFGIREGEPGVVSQIDDGVDTVLLLEAILQKVPHVGGVCVEHVLRFGARRGCVFWFSLSGYLEVPKKNLEVLVDGGEDEAHCFEVGVLVFLETSLVREDYLVFGVVLGLGWCCLSSHENGPHVGDEHGSSFEGEGPVVVLLGGGEDGDF